MSTRRARLLAVGVVAGLVGVAAAPATAGTISGTITAQAGGAAIAGAEVRVWSLGVKGWSILATTTANGAGGYALTVPGGAYLIDARGPASGGNYGDRWYDVAAPLGNGYVGELADQLTVGAAATVTGIDLALEVLGGADGTVLRTGGVEAPNMVVRMERRGEPRIHHNDFTKALPPGLVSFRGLVPAADYQLMVYDPAGVRDTLLLPGPYTVTSNVNGTLGSLQLADYAADPYEGNNTANCSTVSVNASLLHMSPPQPWQSAGARIGPLANSDVDWFCFTAVEGDRLFVTATTAFTFGGAARFHPWTDPLLSFWQGARVTRLAEDDDGGPGPLDAMLDTGPLGAGCHCAAVTTFGDPNYVGTGQTSTGKYTLRFEMGNRPPVLSIRKGATPAPTPPAVLMLDEDDTLALTLGYGDADGDVVVKSFAHVDSGGAPVPGGVLNLGATAGDYTWTPGPLAAAGSPYVLRLDGADGEFAMTKTVLVVVNAVNHPPTTPVLASPVDDAVTSNVTPVLTWANATDPDSNPLTYDLEIYYASADGAPAQQVAGVVGGVGMTSWTVPVAIAENTRVLWRARASDGLGGLSPWSPFGRFLVDLANDAPGTPVLIKPIEGELLYVRRPALSVLNVEDAEDDELAYTFQIATDADFTSGSRVWDSGLVPMNTMSATTMTVTDTDLPWGDQYFARVRAEDDRGGVSAWSDWHSFRIKENLPPGAPTFVEGCAAVVYDEAAPVAITVRNVNDPEGEPVVFELEMFGFDDPADAAPVYATSVRMDPDTDPTAIGVDLSALANGHYRYRVRAFDGTDASDWVGCELTLELPAQGSPAGGCCSTGGDPLGAAALLLVVGAIGGRRRRGRRRRGRAR